MTTWYIYKFKVKINKNLIILIITGGGRKNLFIMKNLKNALKNIKIIKIDKLILMVIY